ncbi:MAG: chloride channel protein [Nitrospiraceae bacterium]|nr:chloride channel protein [Nitrospiraceae bacterium]
MDSRNLNLIKPLGPFKFAIISALLGILTGFGAVVFRGLIALVHNLVFLGKFSFIYDATLHTHASPWGPFIILGPVIGGAVVVFLVQKYAPEAKGHGVPEVIDAIYYYRGVIRPIVAGIKAAASSISIGSGGSVGREGPIVQIGSSVGSTMGQLMNLPLWQRMTLIAAGTGGGIAATFNTPIGGIFFAFELMMQEFSIRTLVPVAISTVIATYIGQLFFGPHPAFVIPGFETPYFHIENPVVLVAYGGLGAVVGVASALFIKSIYAFEDFFDKKVSRIYLVRHLTGMFIVGVMFYLLMKTRGHYFTEGVGYATIQDILTGSLTGMLFLSALFCLKLIATSLTLGSGASGGIFSPALFMGATLGGAYGFVLHSLFPGLGINPAAFAVVGMAGMAGGVTGAAIAAIVMIFEMTLNYNVMLPMVITVTISYGVRKVFSKESIYTMKLARRKHFVVDVLQRDMQDLKTAGEIMETHLTPVDADMTVGAFLEGLPKQPFATHYVVISGGAVAGIIGRYEAFEKAAQDKTAKVADMAQINYATVTEDLSFLDIMAKLHEKRASIALVIEKEGDNSAGNVKGIITPEEIGKARIESLELLSD